jgi:DNA polymerase-3 subunit delta'
VFQPIDSLYHINQMPIVDLYGHEELRERLAGAAEAGTLPASLLLHGPRGVGKQRLALWLGQLLLCEAESRPCGECRSCRYSTDLTHPDLHWYFPRPRLKDADPDLADVREDYDEVIRDRVEHSGLYSPAPGNEGIFVATVRALIQQAAMTPAMGKRKVFVIGDAERMGLQEGAEFAANAFLKLLEEPSPKTTIIITSSEPGALLPTIRSRTVGVRVPLVPEPAVRRFIADPAVTKALGISGQKSVTEKVQMAGGAPGTLFGDDARAKAMAAARKILDAAASPQVSQRHAAAMSVGAAGARGSFSDILDALVILLGERMRAALHDGNNQRALAVSRASDLVGNARIRASGNVNPQLLASSLLRELSAALR